MHANALQPRRRCLMLAALTLGTIFAATLTARAAAPRSTLPPIFAFSDARSLPTTATLLARLPGTRARLCPAGTPAPLTPLTLAQALDDVIAALVRTHGRAALTALAHGPLGHGAGTAEHAMAGAIIAGSPDAALVAALLAHQQAPDDPRPLVDMAAVLPDRGMARQALALLDAADLMRYPTDAPLGISLSAVSANNRGYALLALHRWQQAEAPLTHAARLAPHLSEAGLNLGEAYLCAGDDLHAARAFLSGGRRDSFRPDQVEGAGDPPITEQVRPDQIFDLSAGIARRLPDLTYPLTPQQAVALEPTYQHIITVEENARTAAVNAAMIRAIQHLHPYSFYTSEAGYWRNWNTFASHSNGLNSCNHLDWMISIWLNTNPNIPLVFSEDNWSSQPNSITWCSDQNGCEGSYLVDTMTWLADHSSYAYPFGNTPIRFMWFTGVDFSLPLGLYYGGGSNKYISSIAMTCPNNNTIAGTNHPMAGDFSGLVFGGSCY